MAQPARPAMLAATALGAWYGRARILWDVSLQVAPGEVVVLLGRNGAGKSTTLKTLMGLLHKRRGQVCFEGQRIDALAPYQIACLGLGYVPEDRRIFTDLSVLENLEVGRQRPRDGIVDWDFERIGRLFPNLAEMPKRLGGQMSGGEQQMLAIARTLMGNPRCILLDEPSEGIAPVIVDQMAAAIGRLKEEGVAVLLSEQNFHFAQQVANRAYIIEQGRIRFEGTMAQLVADRTLSGQYLAV